MSDRSFVFFQSTETAVLTKAVTTQFISKHDGSAKRNIMRDVERVQARCRQWDTDHFATYCQAFEPVHHSRVMLQTASLNVECELAPMRQLLKTARELRDKAGEASLKAKQTELRQQKSVLDADIGEIASNTIVPITTCLPGTALTELFCGFSGGHGARVGPARECQPCSWPAAGTAARTR